MKHIILPFLSLFTMVISTTLKSRKTNFSTRDSGEDFPLPRISKNKSTLLLPTIKELCSFDSQIKKQFDSSNIVLGRGGFG